jgi:hypothetical protein
MKIIMLCEYVREWVIAKSGHRLYKLAQNHHCIRSQLMNLNLVLVEDLNQEIVARWAKTSKKQTFEDQDFIV